MNVATIEKVMIDLMNKMIEKHQEALLQINDDTALCKWMINFKKQWEAEYRNGTPRVYDIADPFRPSEVAHYVPPNPVRMVDTRPNRPKVILSADCFVDRNGLMAVTDANAGLHILQFNG
jgi:hypothetical protein